MDIVNIKQEVAHNVDFNKISQQNTSRSDSSDDNDDEIREESNAGGKEQNGTNVNISDSESDDENIEIQPPPAKIVELVDIESDSPAEEEELTQENIAPRRAGLRQRRHRPCFKEKSDTDESEEEIKPKKMKIKLENRSDGEKGFTTIDEPVKLLRRLNRNPESDLLENYAKCFVDGKNLRRRETSDAELTALKEIMNKYGYIIEHLSLNVFSWEEKSSSESPFNLQRILQKLCKNLTVLKLRGCFQSIQLLPASNASALNIGNLREFNFTCGVREGNHQPNELNKMYLNIFNAASGLEKLEYTFSKINEADEILQALRVSSESSNLKNLRKLKFRSGNEEGVLKKNHISDLSCLKSPLEQLELGNGFWEDVDAATFEKMLSRFPKLQKLIIHGTRQGDPYANKNNDLLIRFPRMEKLNTLSIGAEYEFASIFQNPASKRGNVLTVKEKTLEFLKFQIVLPQMPNLKSIVLGNLINIDRLNFKDFPKLEIFKVGGPWNATCNFLSQPSHYGVTELQFPDALKDSSLSKRIPELFPCLRKLWVFLPSVVCLRGFFEAMAEAPHVKIEELYLKTQFDFESTLESCLLGWSTSSLRSSRDINNFNLLRRYSHFEEYVKYYNIELPAAKQEVKTEEVNVSPGIGVLKSLKVLQMEHIPRILRIPIGKYHWSDYRCTLTTDTIGFTRYPLSQKCIDELPVKQMESCLWPNFEFTGGSLRKFQDSGLRNWDNLSDSDDDDLIVGERKKEKLKVTVEPSMLRMAEFKVKNEGS